MADHGKNDAHSSGPSSPHADRTLLYLHGFLSSAQSTKARFLRERFKSLPQVTYHAIDFNPTPRDFETMTTTGQINRLRQYVLDHGLSDMGLVGSSFGGLVAFHYAHRFGGVTRMLLLAPAVVWLSGGLSDQELRQWEKAGAAPVHIPSAAVTAVWQALNTTSRTWVLRKVAAISSADTRCTAPYSSSKTR